MTTYVMLGRYGDILNILPILWNEAQWGRRAQLMVSERYAGMLDGVSYVDPVIYKGDYSELLPAIRQAQLEARDHMGQVVNLQVFGKGHQQPRVAPDFCREQWNNGDYLHLWGQLPLVIDRRSTERERALLRAHPVPQRAVLVSAHGLSSPFAHGHRLKDRLLAEFGSCVVDLDQIQAHRPYDMLALYERAGCLVSIDTMHLHLAPAVGVPTVALITPGPTPWHGAAEKPGQILRVKYDEYDQRENELVEAVRLQVGGVKRPSSRKQEDDAPRVVHVYPLYKVTGRDSHRHHLARMTWIGAYGKNWRGLTMMDGDMGRSALDVGDHRQLPFVQDMIDQGCKIAGPNGIVVLSNSDVIPSSDIAARLEPMVMEHGAVFTHRWDFERIDKAVPDETIPTGRWYPGSDCFAFTVKWWMQHGEEYPDMLMGAEYVDAVLRQLIKKHGGVELHHAIYHERHHSYWEDRRHRKTNPANVHNGKLAAQWFAAHNCDDLDPFPPKQAERIRRQRRAA